MISAELLRRYPFFAHLEDAHLKSIAMITNDIRCQSGETLFEANQPAGALYFLIEGEIDLHYIVTDVHDHSLRRDFFVGHVNPGEPVGISALIEPYQYTLVAHVNAPSRLLKIDAAGLRALCEGDVGMAAVMMHNIARAAMARLQDTRTQLAAARA
jgi:CRP-like cAMP-binding protein